MKIKICGLFQVEDIDYVNEAKPDYVGFVFAKSKRQVDIHQAEKLKNKLDSNIKAVGVFVDEQISEITAIVKMGIIDLIQLHGHEDNAYIKQLKEELINDLYKYSLDTKQCVFDDLMIEYEDGCIIGEVTDFVRLGHQATIKPLDRMTLKANIKSTSKILLQWKKLDRVSGYAIYRYDSGKQQYKKIKTVSTQETSYTDSKLKSGKTYCYKIVPYRSITYTDAGNLCKVVNGSSSNIAKCITKPGKPVIKAKRSGRRIKVKIKKVSRASGYKVYLRKGKKGQYKVVKTYKGNRTRTYKSRKLKRKKTYYVKVRAYKTYQSKKYFGKYSKAKKVKIPKK